MDRLKSYLHKFASVVVNFLCGIFIVIVIGVVLQVFCISSFRIPSDSMEPTLEGGDRILVNKLEYGARLFNVFEALKREPVQITRMPGVGEVKRNDVIVFNNPYPRNGKRIDFDVMKYYVKRCIALPGDTFRIVDGNYRVSGYNGVLGNMSSQEKFRTILKESGLSRYEKGMRAYPTDSLLGWTLLDFGPFYIPRKGGVVKMDSLTVRLYKKVMEWEQQKKIRYEDETVWLGDSIITQYRFKENYYFVAGDRTENSRDSRYWGLLPEPFIVGRACRIWKSVDTVTDKIRWERIWKKIE